MIFFFFFFNDTATTEIYTLSLHDALPICERVGRDPQPVRHLAAVREDIARLRRVELERYEQALVGRVHHDAVARRGVHDGRQHRGGHDQQALRSEEHTSELQSRLHLVCRLLLEKKKTNNTRLPVRPRLKPERQETATTSRTAPINWKRSRSRRSTRSTPPR